jgi:hypothetical protein
LAVGFSVVVGGAWASSCFLKARRPAQNKEHFEQLQRAENQPCKGKAHSRYGEIVILMEWSLHAFLVADICAKISTSQAC